MHVFSLSLNGLFAAMTLPTALFCRLATSRSPALVVTLALVGAGLLVAPVQAQEEENPTVGVSYWKCDWAEMEELEQIADSVAVPIYQEMVDEGEIRNWEMMTHQWGDSWNVVFSITADDTPSFLEAFEEANRRMQEQHPDLAPLSEYCSDHKDNIYTLSSSTSGPDDGSQ